MPTLINANKAKADAEGVLGVWQLNPDLKVVGATLAGFEADIAKLKQTTEAIEAEEKRIETTLTPLRNLRDDLAKKLNAVCVAARKSIAGTLGEDSTEYELAGGTRTSERKRTGVRKATSTTTAK